MLLEGTAHYAGLLLAPGEGFGLQAKKGFLMLFLLILGHFWCSEVTSLTFSSNLGTCEEKKPKKNQEKS